MDLILGIDPGISGGAVLLGKDRGSIQTAVFARVTPSDIATWLSEHKTISMGFIERVHSMPLQGVVSVFKFGENFGLWQGLLTALKIPFQYVTPQTWQTYMSCRTGGNKNISKARAQELFPNLKVTHAIADALLIAEYGRRQELGLENKNAL